MRRLSMVLAALSLFYLASTARAQNLVNLSITVPQYNQLYVADLDIKNVKSSGILFTATLQSMATTPIQVKLNLAVIITLVGESPFQIAQATSTPLTLDPGQMKVITNLDLSGDNPPIHLESYSYDQQEFDKIKNVALATGKAPAGVYKFVLKCVDANNALRSNIASGEIVVTNPSRVELTLPVDRESITTPFPHFQWSANADTIVLSVYEKRPYQQSPEDVVSGVPFLKQTVSGGSFNYPPSGPGVRPLQSGRTYYWYVKIPASSTRGSGLTSDIWSFSIQSSTTSSSREDLNNSATQALKNLLTGTQYQSRLSRVIMLNGDATYDGSSISTQELIDMLQNMNRSKIINVIIQ